jgi:hypothetical protein
VLKGFRRSIGLGAKGETDAESSGAEEAVLKPGREKDDESKEEG